MRLEQLPAGSRARAARLHDGACARAAAGALACLLALLALLALAPAAFAQGAPSSDAEVPAQDAPQDAPSSDAEVPAQAAPQGAPSSDAEAPAEGAPQDAPSSDAEAPAEGAPQVTGSLHARASFQGGSGNDRLSTRLGLEWLAGRWAGGFSLEVGNDLSDHYIASRSGVGSFDLSERWFGWSSRGPRRIELRLGTARGVTFGQGLVLGSPTFDGLELSLAPAPSQRTIVLAGRTESIDPDDLLEREPGLFPSDDELGSDGELLGLRHEIRKGTGLLGVNLVRARAEGAPAASLLSADWAFSKGIVDVATEVAVRDGGGWGAFAHASVTPADTWGVTVQARRYSDFASPLDSAPRYEGLSSADEQDETGALVRLDFSPHERLSGSASFDWSQGGDSGSLKSTVRRDARLALRWAVTDRTSLAYGFELEDLSKGRDGRVHSLLLTQSFRKLGRLSARLSVDRATADPRDGLRVSWRVPVMKRKVTLLLDATLRRETTTTKELQAGASVRLGSSSFLTARVTVSDDSAESLDLTWYRRF